MELKENNWKLGEIVKVPRQEKVLKDGSTSYVQYIESRFICIREATEDQRGILLKVLGKSYSDQIKTVGGEPFGLDDHAELFNGHRYYSYRFPSVNEVKEVLDILRDNYTLLQKFDEAKMHVNPNSLFWVRETSRNVFLKKSPQVYDGREDKLCNPSDDTNYYRITVAYFSKDQLTW